MTKLTQRFVRGLTAAALTLTIGAAVFAAAPAQASGLQSLPISTDHECLTKSEIKYEFEQDYDLRHVSVSRTSEHYIYYVVGYLDSKSKPAEEEMSFKFDDSGMSLELRHVRYVFLFDACHDRVLEQLSPREELQSPVN